MCIELNVELVHVPWCQHHEHGDRHGFFEIVRISGTGSRLQFKRGRPVDTWGSTFLVVQSLDQRFYVKMSLERKAKGNIARPFHDKQISSHLAG